MRSHDVITFDGVGVLQRVSLRKRVGVEEEEIEEKRSKRDTRIITEDVMANGRGGTMA